MTAVDGNPVIDFHARLHPHDGGRHPLIAAMDRCSIDRAVVCAGGLLDPCLLAEQVIWGGHQEVDADNDALLQECHESDGRLVPFYFANPHRGADTYRVRATDFRGVEVSPAVHGVPLTDERTAQVVAVAADVGHPVYTVTLGREGSAPRDLVTLARRFPEVDFVLGHCGFIGIDLTAVRDVVDQHNISVETSGCYTSIARAAVRRLGAHRVLFGSEFPGQDPSVELAKYRALALHRDDWLQVSYDNALRLLGPEHATPVASSGAGPHGN